MKRTITGAVWALCLIALWFLKGFWVRGALALLGLLASGAVDLLIARVIYVYRMRREARRHV